MREMRLYYSHKTIWAYIMPQEEDSKNTASTPRETADFR